MRVVVLHGTARQGTTWRLTRLLLERLPQAQVWEFAFPREPPPRSAGAFSWRP